MSEVDLTALRRGSGQHREHWLVTIRPGSGLVVPSHPSTNALEWGLVFDSTRTDDAASRARIDETDRTT